MGFYELPQEESDRIMEGTKNNRMKFKEAYYTFCKEYSSWKSNSKYQPKELMKNSEISAYLESYKPSRNITVQALEKEISILYKLVYGPSDGVMWFQLLAEMDWPKRELHIPDVLKKKIYRTIAKEFYHTHVLTSIGIFHDALYLLPSDKMPPQNIVKFYAACDKMSKTVQYIDAEI